MYDRKSGFGKISVAILKFDIHGQSTTLLSLKLNERQTQRGYPNDLTILNSVRISKKGTKIEATRIPKTIY